MKDLGRCLTSKLNYNEYPKSDFLNNKFNQLFVMRDCQNSKTDIEKLVDMKAPDNLDSLMSYNNEFKFVCMYDYSYAVLNLKMDDNNRRECSLELIDHYIPTNKEQAE